MSKIYVSEFEQDGVTLYGLFYDDHKGERHPHEEDWKHVTFESEDEANAKLAELAAERAREDAAVPLTLEEAKSFAESHQWKFASTYAQTAPHEYLVKRWLSEEDKLMFERFVQTMKHNSVVGYFYSHRNDYLILGDHYYWFMVQYENKAINLINRTTTDYLELKDGVYRYRGGKK